MTSDNRVQRRIRWRGRICIRSPPEKAIDQASLSPRAGKAESRVAGVNAGELLIARQQPTANNEAPARSLSSAGPPTWRLGARARAHACMRRDARAVRAWLWRTYENRLNRQRPNPWCRRDAERALRTRGRGRLIVWILGLNFSQIERESCYLRVIVL